MLELNVRYEWWVIPPNTHRSLFPISIFCAYSVLRHINWNIQIICGHSAYRTTVILSETLLMWFKGALEIWLESYSPRHASVVLWYNTVHAYTASPYVHCFWYGTTPDNKTYIPYDCMHIIHQTMTLLSTMHWCKGAKLASYTTRCSVFSII